MKAQTHVENCHSVESPRLGAAEAPPFSKGGFGLCTTKAPLPKGAGTAYAVTEGFTVGTFRKYRPMWKGEGLF